MAAATEPAVQLRVVFLSYWRCVAVFSDNLFLSLEICSFSRPMPTPSSCLLWLVKT